MKQTTKQKIKIKFAGATDIGRRRENNEDIYLINEDKRLFIVADGIGGHNAGEVASRMAVTAVEDFILNRRCGNGKRISPLQKSIKEAIKAANEKVIEAAEQNPLFKGMGCALVAAVFGRKIMHIVHIGDVRAYIIRGSEIKQVTDDHSVAAELMRQGRITPGEARKHPRRHILTKCIGGNSDKYLKGTGNCEPDYSSVQVKPGDCIFFCSDGLTDMLMEGEIKEIILKNQDMEKSVSDLIDAANAAGGKDNITVILLKFY